MQTANQVPTGQELERAASYLAGRGVPKDPAQAAYWYRRAAEQGNPDAQMVLAYMYARGIGVDKDASQELMWNLKAVASGSSEAKVNLACMYLRGEGLKQDTGLALNLLREAAQESGRAEAYLGTLYYLGLGVPADRHQAESWLRKGVKRHDPQAEFAMATIEFADRGRPEDLNKAAALLRASSLSGYVPAMHSYGLLLVNHPEIKREPGAEVRMLETAAEAGSWRSSAVLGILARDGRYLPKDALASYSWFRIAVLEGGPPAESYLGTTLVLAGKALGENPRERANQIADAWLLAHPRDDLFAFKYGLDSRFFPFDEVYTASQAPDRQKETKTSN